METFDRITFDPAVMGGQAWIRGMRVTVSMILGTLAAGHPREQTLAAYLEPADIDQALACAAWRTQERELPVASA